MTMEPQRPALGLDEPMRWLLQQLSENANWNGNLAVCALADALTAGDGDAAESLDFFVGYATGVCDALRWLAGDPPPPELVKSISEPGAHVHAHP